MVKDVKVKLSILLRTDLLRHFSHFLNDLRLRDGADHVGLVAAAAQVKDGDDALLRSRVEHAPRVVHLDLDEGVLLVEGRAHEGRHQEGESDGNIVVTSSFFDFGTFEGALFSGKLLYKQISSSFCA